MAISGYMIGQVSFNFNFDDCTYEESSIMFPGITPGGNPKCICGIDENSISLDGFNDYLTFSPQANILFDSNFTFDFYFQMEEKLGQTDIFSIRNGCSNLDSLMTFRYLSSTNELVFEIGSNVANYFSVRQKLDKTNCWHRFTLVKFGLEYQVYYDNKLASKFISREDIKFTRSGTLNFGNSPCNTSTLANRFSGRIDEITMYKRALSELEILENFKYPDRIITENATIFLGESITLESGTTCATSISWTPSTSLDDDGVPNPKATPTVSTTYVVKFNNNTCISTDSVRIFVAERDKLDCSKLLLPKAFTPNNDGLNDRFGISNIFLVESLSYFEIYDRWGAKVWETNVLAENWDGTHNNVPLNGGMYLYKIKYFCNGTEQVNVNNFMMLR